MLDALPITRRGILYSALGASLGAGLLLSGGQLATAAVAPMASGNAWGGHANGRIPLSQLTKVGDYHFRTDAAIALIAMRSAYQNALGRVLELNAGYRDYAGQQAMWRRYQNGGNLAARPGTSNHGWAVAVDLGGEVARGPGTTGHQWLRNNAERYGWWWAGRTFSQVEPWHWEYRGGYVEPEENDSVGARYSGADRYTTAATTSARTFAPGVAAVVVASGLNFPDALAGAAAAGGLGGPVLLTRPTDLPAVIRTEIARLQPQKIIVLGGPSVISDAVFTELSKHTAGETERIHRDDRYDTAAALSAAVFEPGVPVAYVASGRDFPDALAASAAAGAQRGPVLLSRPGDVPMSVQDELARLQPGRIVVLGGSAILSDAVRNTVAAYTAGATTRMSGAHRYDTAAKTSAASFSPGVPVVFIASGVNFPDALAGAAAAGQLGGPVLLTRQTALPEETRAELARLKPRKVVVLGGQSTVFPSVLRTARGFVQR